MKRGRKPMPAAEKELADRFRELVLAKRPVLFLAGFRSHIVDPHHVLPRNGLSAHPISYGLEPEELWAILWDPDNGTPVERGYHDLLTTAARRIKATELRAENIAFAERLDLVGLLERECPSFDPSVNLKAYG